MEAETIAEIRIEAWLQIEDDSLSIQRAVAELAWLGNTILAVDEPNRRIKVCETTIQQEGG